MKILLINNFIDYGGTEVQSKREIDNFFSHGDEIYYLTFDNRNYSIINDKHYNIVISKTKIGYIYNKLFYNPFLKRKIAKIVKKINPDYIHLNNIYYCPITLYRATKQYKTIQTIRDFGAVCPKKTCILNDYSECTGYKYKNCLKCCNFEHKTIKFRLFKKINKYKNKSVNIFISPSQALTDKANKNGLLTLCVNNPFDFSKCKVIEKTICDKKYLYYGLIADFKGIYKLIDAFVVFSKNRDVTLDIIGKFYNDEEKAKFEDYIKVYSNIRYLGSKKNEEIMDYFQYVYCTIVPSLWLENYPNTVLETQANKTLVIGSNRGGIIEMIHNENLLFDVLDINSIVKTLIYTYDMSNIEYYNIVNDKYKELIEKNTLEKFYQTVCDTYKKI